MNNKIKIVSIAALIFMMQAVAILPSVAFAAPGIPFPVTGQVNLDGVPADGATVVVTDTASGATTTDIVGPTGASLTSGWYSVDLNTLATLPVNGNTINIVATINALSSSTSFVYNSASGFANPSAINIVTPPASSFTILASAGANGAISPLGTTTVSSGASSTFSITPSSGFNVLDVLVDGVSVGAVSSYTFGNVLANHTISATFTSNPITTYTIMASAGAGGAISPTGTTTVNSGASSTFTITPSAGFNILNVLVDGVSVGALSTYTFTSVLANHTISASFVSAPVNTYTITSSAGANISIAPLGVTTINAGSNQTYTINPSTGFYVGDVLVDGASVGAVSSYTFTNVLANHTISTTYSAVPVATYTLIASASANGTISSVGTTTINSGNSKTYTFAPNAGYMVSSVLIDGVSNAATSSYTFSNVTANHTITIAFLGVPVLSSINVSPAAPSIVASTTQQFTASTLDQYGSPISATTTWSSSNNSIATINSSTGLATGVATGTVTITASSGAVSGTTTLTVTAPVVVTYGIYSSSGANGMIMPMGTTTVNSGGSQSYTITPNAGYYVQTLLVDGVSVATSTSYVFSNVVANHSISATFALIPVVVTPVLTTINVSPANPSVIVGNTQQFSAATLDQNGSAISATTTWSSSNTAVATIDASGLATALSAGTTTITASSGAVSGVANLTVASAPAVPVLTTINVSPAAATSTVGSTQQFSATTLDQNGSAISATTTWSSSNTAVATVDSSGLVTAVATGTVMITASSGAVSGMATYVITAVPALATYNLVATAGANGSISPLGTTVVNSGASQSYTITANSGYNIQDVLVDGVSVGAVGTYSFSNVTANHTISASFVVIPVLTTINVTPANSSITIASGTQQFTASGLDQNGAPISVTATWSSSDIAIATIDSAGLATAVATGTVTITASSGAVSGTAILNIVDVAVTPVLTSIVVSPATSSVMVGGTQQFTASTLDQNAATFTATVSWLSSDTAIATVDPASGLVTAVASGTATITASSGGISGSATITVTPVPVVTYDLVASAGANGTISQVGTTTVNSGASQTYTITANSGYNIQDVLVDGVSVGTSTSYTFSNVIAGHTISASFAAVAAVPVLTTINVSPSAPSIAVGATQQFTASTLDQNGASIQATTTWSSSNNAIATVNSSGLATAIATGTVTITASSGAVSGSAMIIVTLSATSSLGIAFTAPANLATMVPLDASVNAVFNSFDVDIYSVNSTTYTVRDNLGNLVTAAHLHACPGCVRQAEFIPASPFQASTTYTATLSGVKNLAGQIMPDYSWTFTTAGVTDVIQPAVSFTFGINGETNVPVEKMIKVVFNKKMNPTTINANTFYVTDSLGNRLQGLRPNDLNSYFVIQPYTYLKPNEVYTGTLTTGVTDLSGVPLATPYTWSFTTGPAAIVPSFVLMTPMMFATSVPVDTAINVIFKSYDINPTTINAQTFLLTDNLGNPVTASRVGMCTSCGRQAEFIPASPLSPSTTYTATLTTGVKNLAGNSMRQNLTWTFTTAPGMSMSMVAFSLPFNGESDISTNKPIRVVFNKQMNSVTVSSSTFSVIDNLGNTIPGAISNIGNIYFTFTPVTNLVNNKTYTVNITTGILDASGMALPTAYTSSFTTLATTTPILTTIIVTPSAPSMTVGATQQLTASTLDHNGVAIFASTTWSSSNTAVATVNASGLVNSISAGSVIITAQNGSISGTSTITVNAPVQISYGGGGGGGGSISGGLWGGIVPLGSGAGNNISKPKVETDSSKPIVETEVHSQTGKVLGVSTFAFNSNLSFGTKHDDVKMLQNTLSSLGLYNGPVTGTFGSLTKNAVKTFQAKNGLPQTGYFGPMTRTVLNNVSANISSRQPAQSISSPSNSGASSISQMTLSQFVQMLIQMGAIPADKLNAAKKFVQ